jgi:isocitrate dehydrogenase kinase/phosphatase
MVVDGTQAELGEAAKTAVVWAQMKAAYSRLIAGCGDFELAETFFNSITRRIFATVGVDHAREFIDSDFNLPPARSAQPVYATYRSPATLDSLVASIIEQHTFAAPFRSLNEDVQLAAHHRAQLAAVGVTTIDEVDVDGVDVLKSIFFRNKGPISSGGSDRVSG